MVGCPPNRAGEINQRKKKKGWTEKVEADRSEGGDRRKAGEGERERETSAAGGNNSRRGKVRKGDARECSHRC